MKETETIKIYLKSEADIEKMKIGGKILASALRVAGTMVKPGVVLKDIDKEVESHIRQAGAKPAFLGYRPAGAREPYPASICASVNETVVHGLPGEYALKAGDIVSIDLGVRYQGFCTDAARTFRVGKVEKEVEQLLLATQEALEAGIRETWPKKTLGDIGYAIESVAKEYRVAVADLLTGHGIGRDLHEEPTVYNYGEPGEGVELKVGMVIAIEPMFILGDDSRIMGTREGEYKAVSGRKAAHFEQTVAVTGDGPCVLTK